MLLDTVRAIEQVRREGRTVLDDGRVAYLTTDGGTTAPPPDGIVRPAQLLRILSTTRNTCDRAVRPLADDEAIASIVRIALLRHVIAHGSFDRVRFAISVKGSLIAAPGYEKHAPPGRRAPTKMLSPRRMGRAGATAKAHRSAREVITGGDRHRRSTPYHPGLAELYGAAGLA